MPNPVHTRPKGLNISIIVSKISTYQISRRWLIGIVNGTGTGTTDKFEVSNIEACAGWFVDCQMPNDGMSTELGAVRFMIQRIKNRVKIPISRRIENRQFAKMAEFP